MMINFNRRCLNKCLWTIISIYDGYTNSNVMDIIWQPLYNVWEFGALIHKFLHTKRHSICLVIKIICGIEFSFLTLYHGIWYV